MTMVGQQVMEPGANYGLSVIPLFILMGSFIHRSGISEDLLRAAYALIGYRKGDLAQATVLASAGFSAVFRVFAGNRSHDDQSRDAVYAQIWLC